uniref:non-specific serine/threonine protein kinase n=1 Tax=Aegilops tauschii subsp. strangulata TaxID=200361 RepID=A0A452XK26_AEGTS
MGPANLLFIIVAVSAQLLSEAWLNFTEYPTANLSTSWTNNESSFTGPHVLQTLFYDGSAVRSLVLSSPQPILGPYFGAGFFCASPCNVFLFAIYIFHIRSDTKPHMVWSANRARPVREGATIELTIDGNLVLRDADGSLVWSSGSSERSVAGMVITEDCNLVLFDRRNGTVWQSFDHPSDVLLPGQSLLEGTRLVANTAATNWTENQVYMTVLPRGTNGYTGLYGYVGSTPSQLYYAFSAWVSENDTGNGPTKVTFLNSSLSLLVQTRQPSNPRMHNISLPAAKSTQYVRLESDGHLRLYEWSEDLLKCILRSDVTMLRELNDDCEFPTVCGEYGICTAGQCTCPFQDNSSSINYFKPVHLRKANLGCAPLNSISCQEMQHHKLLTLTDVSYFDTHHTIENATNVDSCKQACLKNCSCRAVIFRYHLNDSESECLWVTKVFSLKSIQPETAYFNSSAYLKVQSSPSSAASHPHQLVPRKGSR